MVLATARVNDDAPVYIVHLSAHESLSRVRLARTEGQQNIYIETCPHYLVLTDEKFRQGGPKEAIKYMMAPPLRKKRTTKHCGKACVVAIFRLWRQIIVPLPLRKIGKCRRFPKVPWWCVWRRRTDAAAL